jgi:hypothetical protein
MPSIGNQQMADLVLSFDPGASLTKSIYRWANESTPHLLTTEPEIIQLPQSSIDSYLSSRSTLSTAKPEDEAWIECNGEAECQIVGFLARQFLAAVRVDKLKYETAFYKVLAVVGAIAQQTNLSSKFSLALMIPLPYGEYQNRHRLEQQLRNALRDFKFRGQRIRARLEAFECRPEGAGLAMIRVKQNGLEWFQRQAIAVLMFGHRNTSVLMFERGTMTAGYTTNLGFYQLVKQVVDRTSGQDILSLTSVIYTLGSSLTTNHSAIRSILRSQGTGNADIEAQQLVRAIASARVDYWRRLQEWLETTLPRGITEVILSGGAAMYLHDEIERFFSTTPTYWGIDLQNQVQERFSLDYRSTLPDKEALAFRLVDVYGLFLSFSNQVEQHESLRTRA